MRYQIRNGMIVDGTGRKPYAGTVEIADGKISAILPGGGRKAPGENAAAASSCARRASGPHTGTDTEASGPDAEMRIIDAGGAYVTPGFIDIHRHGDWMALTGGDDELLARQGITTVVNGNCGLSAAPQAGSHEEKTELFLRSFLGAKPASCPGGIEDPARSMEDYLASLRAARRSVHTGMLAGGGTIRASVAGYGSAPLSAAQEEQIREKFRESLRAGALGISLGIGYAPEFAYDEDGLVRVLEPVRGSGIPVAVHIRTEGDGAAQAAEEMIRVARRLDTPLHLSHMKCIGRRNWRVTCARELEMIRQARAEGMDVTIDTYPYITGATQLVHLIPPRFQAGGTAALMERLRDPDIRAQITGELRQRSDEYENIAELAGFEHIAATGLVSEAFRPFEGKTIAETAAALGRDPYDTLYDILLAEECEPAMLDTYGCEEDMTDFLKDETCSLISDAIYPEGGKRHPRVYDAFPRFLIRYVRDRQVFPIEEAVRKMTSLPAALFGLDRGELREGMSADICVFRLEKLRSEADFAHPDRMCGGFGYVFTGGEMVVEHDVWRNTGSGSVLTGSF